METVNAFIGKTTAPTEAEVDAALGSTAALWKQLVDWMAEQGAAIQEWNSYSPKAGWALRLKVKKRNIVYLGPCAGCFRASFHSGRQGGCGGAEKRSGQEHAEAARRSAALSGGNGGAVDGEGGEGPGGDQEAGADQDGELRARLSKGEQAVVAAVEAEAARSR